MPSKSLEVNISLYIYIYILFLFDTKFETDLDILGGNKTLAEQLEELNSQLTEIGLISQTVNITAAEAYKTTTEGLSNVNTAETVLDKIHDHLTVS